MNFERAVTPRDLFAKPASYFQKDYFIDIRSELVRGLVGSPAGASVLDLGCGDGRVSLQFCAEASDLTLVDFSDAMLDRARQRVPLEHAAKVQLIQSDISAFDPGRRFDVVLCLGVLPHLPSARAAVSQISSLLSAGGVALIQLTDSGTFLGRMALSVERLRSYLVKARPHWLQPTSVREIERWAADCGLAMDAVERYGVLVPGAGNLPNSVLLRWERLVMAHRGLSSRGADAIVRLRKGRG